MVRFDAMVAKYSTLAAGAGSNASGRHMATVLYAAALVEYRRARAELQTLVEGAPGAPGRAESDA